MSGRVSFDEALLSVTPAPLMKPLILLIALTASLRAGDVDFSHQIVPILREHCAECHAGDKKEGGLSINDRAARSFLRYHAPDSSASALGLDLSSPWAIHRDGREETQIKPPSPHAFR
jgi:hypothetical protein